MNTMTRFTQWARGTRWTIGAAMLAAGATAQADVTMQGAVSLDYYVADVDDEGFEYVDASIAVEQIDNDGTQRSGPLSLSGWATDGRAPTSDGVEVGYVPLGSLGAGSSLFDVADTVPADDVAPGEYYTHVLLQDDRYPGTWEDARSLSPTLLWRGGLEAVGPLYVTSLDGGRSAAFEFSRLQNNRVDSRLTRDIELTLYATYGYGPASDGYVLCSVIVPGIYAGDWRYGQHYACDLNDVPDGGYTLHLEVAEIGGRGGSSALSGPDVSFWAGALDDGYDGYDGYAYYGDGYYAGALGGWLLLPLVGVAALRRRRFFGA